MNFTLRLPLVLVFFVMSGLGIFAAPAPEQIDVFISGQDGYHTYRIPSVIRAKNGALLAFCEGRKTGGGDSGDIDLVLKRSTDGGRSWESPRFLTANALRPYEKNPFFNNACSYFDAIFDH